MNAADQKPRLGLLLGALGVVYGDIGTSPLYALRECFSGSHGIEPTPAHVLGVVSLVVWSLTLIVAVKYLSFVLRASNRGEGGVLALLALVVRDQDSSARRSVRVFVMLGIFGAALLYGDGVITPAITVLGAIEGLEVATPVFSPYVTLLAVAVLVGLFAFQRHGTGRVGGVFGPVMLLWFVVLVLLGLKGIWSQPRILAALSPHHAMTFLVRNSGLGFVVLGAVFLALTGAEALYADLGHFGASPIRRAWFGVVFPGLVLNYLGQGALLLAQPAATVNPFYSLAPPWALYPLVILATAAAVIASQALISGAYSITMQAIQMGFLPRLNIQHTSRAARGQIYIPYVNWLLLLACVGLVMGFGSSSRLAGAYGIAVSLTMLITTVLFHAAIRRLWQWPAWRAGLLCGGFLAVELTFLGANALKIPYGGWFPLVLGVALFTLMATWRTGRQLLRARLAESYLPFDSFLDDLKRYPIQRVPGTAVFLSGNPLGTPIALLHNVKHNKVLHQRIIVLTILTEEAPYVPAAERFQLVRLREDVCRLTGHFGFMEQPDVPRLLETCRESGLDLATEETTFFLSRETIVSGATSTMARWRRRLFAALSRNAQSATTFFNLPVNRVVELGMQIEL